MSVEGVEITGYDQPGELVIKSPSVVLGYLNNAEADRETFQDGWIRTGDVAVIKESPKGNEHCFIVDRIKELIKVKVRVTCLILALCVLRPDRMTAAESISRAFKSHLLNWKRIYSLTLQSLTAP